MSTSNHHFARVSRSRRSREAGSTLITTILVLGFLVAMAAAALQWTSNSNAMAQRERDIAFVEAAADGAMEYYYGQWKKAVVAKNYIGLMSADLTGISAPTPSLASGFTAANVTFTNTSIKTVDPWGFPLDASNPNGYTSDAKIPNGGFFEANLDNYPGWLGLAYYYKASATATMPRSAGIRGRTNSAAIGINRYFQITSVPLFQGLVFFEEDLELHPGDKMVLDGKVHTNKDAWIKGYDYLQFLDQVSYVGDYHEEVSPERASIGGSMPTNDPYWKDGKQSDDSTAKATQLTQVSRIEPFGTAPGTLFSTTDSNTNNDSFHELIEPPNTAQTDPPAIAQQRLFNKATLQIRIDSSKATSDSSRITVSGTALSSISATKTAQIAAVKAAVSSTVSMYDRREQGNVPVTSLDMAKLNTAMVTINAGAATASTAFNGVVYVDDVASGKNAVRLQNGAEISQDLTVASQDPIYIQGDFNTGGGSNTALTSHNVNLVPSNSGGNGTGADATTATGYDKKSVAVIADAVMVLSNNWNDANSSKSLSSRIASHTTVNAAIMAGYLPTDYKNNGEPGGGAHNLVRFLEDWTNKDFTYKGSMVQSFVSQVYQGLWAVNPIYSPPERFWAFDKDFLRRPPPGSVNGFVSSRGRWERFSP